MQIITLNISNSFEAMIEQGDILEANTFPVFEWNQITGRLLSSIPEDFKQKVLFCRKNENSI